MIDFMHMICSIIRWYMCPKRGMSPSPLVDRFPIEVAHEMGTPPIFSQTHGVSLNVEIHGFLPFFCSLFFIFYVPSWDHDAKFMPLVEGGKNHLSDGYTMSRQCQLTRENKRDKEFPEAA